MKTQQEIEQLAAREYWNSNTESRSFIKGYTQCQEDMKPLLKTLFDLWETLAKCGEISVGIDFTKHYERLKQQLNKQD